MRTANDGGGNEPRSGFAAGASPDDEATRVFTRKDHRPADPDATRVMGRGEAADPAATREFSRPDPEGDPGPGASASLTREFVRDRPLPRSLGTDEPGNPRPRRSRPEGARPRGSRPGGRRPAPPPGRRTTVPRPRRRRFRLRWAVALLLVLALALPAGTWGTVWYVARQDKRVPTDALVVLGASQYNGTPSPVFEARLRHAQVLYLEGVAPVIVTVGGKQPGDNYTEAAAGRNWLIEVGVPAEQVVAVEEGSDTLQSFRAVSEVFEANGWDTATVVSDPWHSLRSSVMASDHGIDATTSPARSGPAVIERRTQLWYITRETASLWYYWIFNDSSDIRVNAA